MTAANSETEILAIERRLDWELTSRCNLRCAHCISRYFHDRLSTELSEADAHRVVDRCHEAGLGSIHFFGGEPTVREDLPSLLRHCDELGLITTFNTNGTALGDGLLETLAGLRHRRPLLFSLEDVREEPAEAIRGPGSYGAALDGIRRYREALPEARFVAAFTLTRPAMEALSPRTILEFFDDLGAGRVVFQDLAVPPDAPPELARLGYDGSLWLDFLAALFDPALDAPIPFTYRLKPLVIDALNARLGTDMPIVYYGCNGLSTEHRLLPDGTLLPCSAAVGWPEALDLYLDHGPTLVDRPLDELLAGEPYQRFSRCKRERGADPVMTPCRSCPHAYVRCNPCVFGRMMGSAHTIQTCRWAQEALS